MLGGAIYRISFGALPLLLPLQLQLGLGMSPFRSGLLTGASAIGTLFIPAITKRLLRRLGFRLTLGYNALLAAVSIAALGLFTLATPQVVLLVALLLGGGFRMMQFAVLNSICYAEVPEREISQATSLFATVQQLSLGMGVTLGAFLLEASNWLQRHPRIVNGDFWPTFLVLGIIAAYPAFTLTADAGAAMAGKAAKEVPCPSGRATWNSSHARSGVAWLGLLCESGLHASRRGILSTSNVSFRNSPL